MAIKKTDGTPTPPTFRVGEMIQSESFGQTWIAEVVEVIDRCDPEEFRETNDGYCYETVGAWDDEPNATPTLRSLWSDSMDHADIDLLDAYDCRA